MSHFLLTVPVDADGADALAGELWGLGAVGIEELKDGLRAAFTGQGDADRAQAALAPTATIEVFDDRYGLDAGRDLLRIERAAGFSVHPPWLEPPAGTRAIAIDPGHAFGSGSHASTRLALTLLEDEIEPGFQVLDVGCGTGVLSIGAALLGASAVAVDIDPAAIEATTANALLNNVTERVRATLGSADTIDDPYAESMDLVMMNVTIDIHEALAPTLSRSSPRLLVAGLLGEEQLRRCAQLHRSSIIRSVADEGWMAAVLTRS